MKLELKAKHFKGTDFKNPCNCAISKAARCELFGPTALVFEGVSDLEVHIGDEKATYYHDHYGSIEFMEDSEEASAAAYDDTVIRTIELIKV